MQIHYRVNAGYIPHDHWTQDPSIGGGRIIGEVCHFIDLLQFITSEVPVDVFASSIGGDTGRFAVEDNVEISVGFSGGSLGTITYTALGTKTFSRERVEVYCDESVAVLEDFRRLEFIKGAKKKSTKLWSQDVGYFNELEHFLKVSASDFEKVLHDAVLTTLTTFAAVSSLRTHKNVAVSGSEAES
jgi:predicted dehydrogenase